MNTKHLFGAVTLVAAASITTVIAMNQAGSEAPLEIPANPAVDLPVELVHAQPFELVEPMTHSWSAEQASYTSGLVLVLEGDASAFQPRQTAEPVLFVGDRTADRINAGHPSGKLVVVVPDLTLDELADTPIYFGQPELPERVTAAYAAAELEAALGGGLVGPGEDRVALASDRADTLGALDYSDLMFQVSFLIEQHSPEETDLVEGFRVPRVDFK